jgi:hypothetical protein
MEYECIRASYEALLSTGWVLNGEGRFGSALDGGSVIIQMRRLGAAAPYREPQSSNDFT